ncbi:Hydroxypyruvate isomerase [Rubripirellula tenax]|uniref:Hydroxypyruvate isomerase n=1 Tax=Rubripirellula tenax TaxID=2528015 RepID=A0A5C6EBU5_9BACT|nr:TIM barrel protein [Rubripirellula tenax]TWU46200.1 Hydroxypyruvate isomerase [Rubripirellula tenax]
MPKNAPKYRPSVCIDAVFGTISSVEAIDQVAAAGIKAFEFWGWWDKDLDAIEAARDRHGMQIAACCTKFISLVDPATRDDYLAGLAESIRVAKRLKCPTLISQVGDFRPGVDRRAQHDCLVIGLRQASKLLADSGVTLVIEPLNELIDHRGYFLVRSDEAFEVIDQVESEHVKVVFDIYHQQISEGHVITNLRNNIDKIGHFHAAGNPGRNELTRGELNYPQIFSAIGETNYGGYVGLEYWPTKDAVTGLREVAGWFGQ